MILVTHDLGVVAGRADDAAVMYAGQIVEKAPTAALFRNVRMPYTEALLRSIPKLDEPRHARLRAIPAGRRSSSTRRAAAGSRRGARMPRRSAMRRPRR